ncbi:hypothetical protein [Rhodococcus sp. B50]|uniref:hypothetical protein n=1 Tax=Rhodococcus sp. B50 TaxID=2682847 RepID=UPI001BD57BA6|nr:hypothetical protein [Rhodococcus sp. B50]MBS9371859.1 hypothetical protein [Rhodococcus sp. B50]
MTDAEEPTRWDTLDEDEQRQAREKAEEIDRMYEPGVRPTTVVPGTNGMVSGTAFADMVDEHAKDELPAGGQSTAGKSDADANRERSDD